MNSASARPKSLDDAYGRRITYLRLSITDRCDFRCTYCMDERMEFLPKSELMTFEECLRVVAAFVARGVHKVRITGGEPLVRNDAVSLMEAIGRLPGVRELVLTTNGSLLERHALALRAAGVQRINVSLDSLHPGRFARITRGGDLERVLRGLEAARLAGFERIKLNTVMQRDVNDDDLERLVRFALVNDMDISFIEEMPLGRLAGSGGASLCAEEALARLTAAFGLVASTETTGGPARYWRIPGWHTKVGFIAPHSHNFCASCNRVRVTCTGELHTCLGDEGHVPLLPVLRAGGDAEDLDRAIVEALRGKPQGHQFDRPGRQVMRYMSRTGG